MHLDEDSSIQQTAMQRCSEGWVGEMAFSKLGGGLSISVDTDAILTTSFW